MSIPRVEVKVADQELCIRYYGKRPEMSMKGFVILVDDEPVGIGGFYIEKNHYIAFSEMKDELRKHRKYIALGIRILMTMYDSINRPIYAVANKHEPTAPALLKKLGFVKTGIDSPEGEILIYRSNHGRNDGGN